MNRRIHHRLRPKEQQRFTLRVQDLTFDIQPGNISAGGLFFKAGVLFPIGAVLEIELTYADTSVICKAYVRHRHKQGIGLAFVNPSDKFSALIGIATDLADSAVS